MECTYTRAKSKLYNSLSKINMIDINGYEISKAFTGGEPVNAIYSFGVKVWPVTGPVEFGGLKFTALEAGTIGMTHNGTNETTTKPYISYSKDGVNWIEWDYTTIEVDAGDFIYFKGVNNRIGNSARDYSIFTSTGKIAASGNIMSLLYGDDYEGKLDLSGKDYCFLRIFNSLPITTTPELPATTLAEDCYREIFGGCTLITTAPELPAIELIDYCYYGMFYKCTSLVNAPELPATKLAFMCYGSMFESCTSLVTAPALPSTTLADDCYHSMFSGCSKLVNAPALPATKLATICYYDMFYNCTSLTTAPALPATELANYCYNEMFKGCKRLNNAPELPATTLAISCYDSMFWGCTSLTTAPELPATTLAEYCYSFMFSECSNLTTAPELPATELKKYCYKSMFRNCTKLNYVKANFTTEPSSKYTSYWLSDVASTGTFVANSSATWTTSITRNESTVPAGWTIQK